MIKLIRMRSIAMFVSVIVPTFAADTAIGRTLRRL